MAKDDRLLPATEEKIFGPGHVTAVQVVKGRVKRKDPPFKAR